MPFPFLSERHLSWGLGFQRLERCFIKSLGPRINFLRDARRGKGFSCLRFKVQRTLVHFPFRFFCPTGIPMISIGLLFTRKFLRYLRSIANPAFPFIPKTFEADLMGTVYFLDARSACCQRSGYAQYGLGTRRLSACRSAYLHL